METLIWLALAATVAYFVGRGASEARIKQADAETSHARAETNKVQDQLRELGGLFDKALSGLRDDSALLPSLVRWADTLDEARDMTVSRELRTKKHRARKAAEEVHIARTEARQVRKELRLAMNRIDLYESLAPWLTQRTELTLGELIDAQREEDELRASAERGEDPVTRYVPKAEWAKLTPAQRNQLALDRYCDPRRKRTPWAAGIEYERYVGYTYEQSGFVVTYQGALHGREDLGIDLICEDDSQMLVVQCKRLSPEKQLPVRENTIAQVFGSAEFHRMSSGTTKPQAVLVTTYTLSDEARRFARHLRVDVREFFDLKPIP